MDTNKTNRMKKMMASTIFIIVIVLAMLPSIAMAKMNLSDKKENMPFDPSVFTLPSYVKTGSIDDLIAMTGSYRDSAKETKTVSTPFVEYADEFQMPEISMIGMAF